MPNPLSFLRSWFGASDTNVPEIAAPLTPGRMLRQRIEREPAFELGRHVVIGGYNTYGDEEDEWPAELLEALAEMREAAASYRGSPYHHPVTVSMLAIDWLEMRYASPTFGPVYIGMPAVLDGRWIARDLPRMIDVAATAVVDACTPRDQEEIDAAVERLAKFARFGDALMHAMKDESGAHVTLHSPFGPADVRQHDISGSPYAVYRLPETDDFTDIPSGYEFEAWGLNVSIKRCRSMVYRRHEPGQEQEVWDRRRFVDRALVYFDPTPLPDPNPVPWLRRGALVILDGRRVLTIRQAGQTTFSLPTIDEGQTSDARADAGFTALLGTTITDVRWMTSARLLAPTPDTPDVGVTIYGGRLWGVPAPTGGGSEIRWLDVDAPDRDIDEGMRHALLPALRTRLTGTIPERRPDGETRTA